MRKLKQTLMGSLCLLLLIPIKSDAQFDEVGTFIGTSTYTGDLTERKLEPLELNLGIGLFVRRRLNDRLSLKAHAYRGVLTGNDANGSSERGLWKRNLRFRSELYELGFQLEYSFLKTREDFFQSTPYFFAGLAAFYFNPQADLDGKTFNLRSLNTEGVEYSPLQASVPFGFGFKTLVNDRGSLGIEIGFRKTFTDYLDDVSNTYASDLATMDDRRSTRFRLAYRMPEVVEDAPDFPREGMIRGNPKTDDWYFFFGLTLGLKISR